MARLAGKIAIVTGAARGMGAAISRRFIEEGAQVTLTDVLPEVTTTATALGERATARIHDVADEQGWRTLVAEVIERHGRIDVLVNNAGNMLRKPIGAWTEADIATTFASNVTAGMMLAQEALPHLQATSGAIVFVSSVYTVRAYPGAAPYAATKGAIETLVKVLAAELGPSGVRVNAVRPGAVLTEINQRAGVFTDEQAAARLASMANHHALGRIGTGEEVAEAIHFAACAEWVTGAVIDIDGGLGLGITV